MESPLHVRPTITVGATVPLYSPCSTFLSVCGPAAESTGSRETLEELLGGHRSRQKDFRHLQSRILVYHVWGLVSKWMPVSALCSSGCHSTGDFLSPPCKFITKVGGQDEKGQFKVGRREGEREGWTDGSSSWSASFNSHCICLDRWLSCVCVDHTHCRKKYLGLWVVDREMWE